jgi:hypothetical protein
MPKNGSQRDAELSHAPRIAAVVLVIVGLGIALGACSKCDVPTWQPNRAVPQSCHDGPSQ